MAAEVSDSHVEGTRTIVAMDYDSTITEFGFDQYRLFKSECIIAINFVLSLFAENVLSENTEITPTQIEAGIILAIRNFGEKFFQ